MVASRRTHSFSLSKWYTRFIVGFIIVAIVLIFVIFYFSFSKALIQVTPRVSSVSSDFIADIETGSGNAAPGAVAGVLFETEIELEKMYEATGSKDSEGNVIGTVTVRNNLDRNQPLINQTRLLTADGVLLRLKNRIDVPAGGSVTAEVYADDPSAFEALPPTTFTIPGLSDSAQTKVFAESTTEIKSKPGAIKVVKAVDIARAKESLAEDLDAAAIEAFRKEVSGNFIAIVVSKKMIDGEVSAEVDQVVKEFSVREKMKVTLIGIDQNNIVSAAADRLRQLVSSDMQLRNLNLDNLSYVVQNFDSEAKTANIKIHAEGETVLKEDSEKLDKSNLAGLSDRGVELYLVSFDEIESVDVSLSPFWVKKVPSLPDHITIEVISQ